MNTKTLLAAVVAAVAYFLMGWLVYGMLLKGYMDEHTTRRALAVMKAEPDFLYLILSNLVYGLLIAWSLARMGAGTAQSDFIAGLLLFGLIALSIDLSLYSMMNIWKGRMIMAVDVGVNALMGGIMGALVGLVLGSGNKAS